MSNFFEIDFINTESKKSGDAITIRTNLNGVENIHVVDGGYQSTGDKVVEFINKHYGENKIIDRVVLTHNDNDHAGGLRKVLESFEVKELWMLRPWCYTDELIDKFKRWTSVDNLAKRLKELYPNIKALEDIAIEKDVKIYAPLQGAKIGDFIVLWPSESDYIDLVAESEKTPELVEDSAAVESFSFSGLVKSAINFLKVAWGEEVFPDGDTSAENNMSIIQFANIEGKKVFLCGDAGRRALNGAADYADANNIDIKNINFFQVPHHGSRHNVSTDILDRWLGERLPSMPKEGEEKFNAVISASIDDPDHPRKVVVRAMRHRGAKVVSCESGDLTVGHNLPSREGWGPATGLPYPEELES